MSGIQIQSRKRTREEQDDNDKINLPLTIERRRMHFLETEKMIDCCFKVGTGANQEKIRAHTAFLATASPVFEAMFQGDMAEKGIIVITDIEPEVFNALLKYIYTGKVGFKSFDEVCGLLYAAQKYMLPELKEDSTQHLIKKLHPEETCRMYEIAKLTENKCLMDHCLNKMHTETLQILAGTGFEEAALETVITLFDQECLAINSELDLLNALDRFVAKRESQDDSSIKTLASDLKNSLTIQDALKKIRFLTLTSKEFSDVAAGSCLLTDVEKLCILRKICSPSLPNLMPVGFSLLTTKRNATLVNNSQAAPNSAWRTNSLYYNNVNAFL